MLSIHVKRSQSLSIVLTSWIRAGSFFAMKVYSALVLCVAVGFTAIALQGCGAGTDAAAEAIADNATTTAAQEETTGAPVETTGGGDATTGAGEVTTTVAGEVTTGAPAGTTGGGDATTGAGEVTTGAPAGTTGGGNATELKAPPLLREA